MRIVVSQEATQLVEEQGGRLFVWLKRARCCGGLATLDAATAPPIGREFRKVEGGAEFALYLPAHLGRLPDELHLDVGRHSRRIEAYWDGCAWVT
jgi:hypothetical protein